MNSGDSISFDDDPTCGIVVNIYDSKVISFKMVKKYAEVKFVEKHLILVKLVNHTRNPGTFKSTNNWLKAEYIQLNRCTPEQICQSHLTFSSSLRGMA